MAHFDLLVMTSANLTEEPLCADNSEALQRLSQIADTFLIHDRDIVLRCDDSIVRLDPVNPDEGPVVLRRARGFVPSPVILPFKGEPVLALGPELKGTVCLTRGNRAFIGQHLGDLKNLETLEFLKEVVSHLMDILEVTPSTVIRDLHGRKLCLAEVFIYSAFDRDPVADRHIHAGGAAVEDEQSLRRGRI